MVVVVNYSHMILAPPTYWHILKYVSRSSPCFIFVTSKAQILPRNQVLISKNMLSLRAERETDKCALYVSSLERSKLRAEKHNTWVWI